MNPRIVIQTMSALASAALGLVAALAWNEAIKATMPRPAGLKTRTARCPPQVSERSGVLSRRLRWRGGW